MKRQPKQIPFPKLTPLQHFTVALGTRGKESDLRPFFESMHGASAEEPAIARVMAAIVRERAKYNGETFHPAMLCFATMLAIRPDSYDGTRAHVRKALHWMEREGLASIVKHPLHAATDDYVHITEKGFALLNAPKQDDFSRELRTAGEIAKALDCSEKTVLRHIGSGKLRARKVGKKFRLHHEDDPWKDDTRTFEDK